MDFVLPWELHQKDKYNKLIVQSFLNYYRRLKQINIIDLKNKTKENKTKIRKIVQKGMVNLNVIHLQRHVGTEKMKFHIFYVLHRQVLHRRWSSCAYFFRTIVYKYLSAGNLAKVLSLLFWWMRFDKMKIKNLKHL